VLRTFEREYPFGWLGILAAVAPSSDELVYAHHERGFALLSLRSPELSRLLPPVPARRERRRVARREDLGRAAHDASRSRAGSSPRDEVLEKGVTGMRSFVTAPMQHGSLFLAGDAAHIVPPTGAKGLNLAIADVAALASGLIDRYRTGNGERLAAYSTTCLQRVWRAEHFSWWMTSMLHRRGEDPFDLQLQLAELRYVVSSKAAATTLAENYVG